MSVSLPAISLRISGTRDIIAGRGRSFADRLGESIFDVFDSTGVWVAEWRLPDRADVLEFGANYLLVARNDSSDRPLIEVYRFSR